VAAMGWLRRECRKLKKDQSTTAGTSKKEDGGETKCNGEDCELHSGIRSQADE
jgi:hypothetical protein